MIDLFIGCPRVSTDAQAQDGYSLETQEAALRAYAKRIGAKKVVILTDDISGRIPIRQRPGGTQLYNYIDAGTSNLAVGWYRISRVSRDDDLVELPLLMRDLRHIGAEFHVCDRGRVDLDDHFAKAILILEGASAAKDNRDRSEAITRGINAKASKGLIVGKGAPPYGFDKVGERSKSNYVINEHEAAIIRQVYRWIVADGRPLSWCSTELNKMGVPSPSRISGTTGDCWYSSTLYRLIKRPTVVGRFRHGEHLAIRDDLKILTDHEYAALIETLKTNRENSPRRSTREYLLSGRIRCNCGRKMIGRPNMTGKWYYICSPQRFREGNRYCGQAHIRANTADGIDAQVWAELVKFLSDEKRLRRTVEDINQKRKSAKNPAREQLSTEQKRLDRARLKVERLSESLGGAVGGSVAIIQAQLRKAAEDQASAEKAIASLEQSVNRQSKQIDVRDIVGKVKEIAVTVKTDFSFEFKRNILRLFNVQVQVMERGPIYTRRAEVRLNAILGDDAAFVLECI